MPPKRPLSENPSGPSPKKPRQAGGFRVGPANLPDGAWKRKVTKIKHDLITKAKVKKQYAKVKSQAQTSNDKPAIPIPAEEADPVPPVLPAATAAAVGEKAGEEERVEPEIHPERQALLDEPEPELEPEEAAEPREPRERGERKRRNKQRKPDYYAKSLAAATEAKAAADAKAAEIARRKAEKEKAIADREMYRKKMAKAKTPGRDGKVKLGRESGVLLDRVKRIVEGK